MTDERFLSLKKHWIAWLIPLAGLPVYIIAGWVAASLSAVPVMDLSPSRYHLVRGGGILLALLAVVWLRSLRGRMVMNAAAEGGGDERLQGRYFMAVLLPTLGCEIVAAVGLVLFLIGAGEKVLYGFTAGAAVLMLAYRPKRGEYEYLRNRTDGASGGGAA